MRWHPGELYICSEPHCQSEVLVVREPRMILGLVADPVCVCGCVMERKAVEVHDPEVFYVPASAEMRRDPDEERE